MFHSHSILKSTFRPNPFYLPLLSYRYLQPQMNPNECVLCVKIWHLFLIYVIESIDSKLISVCFINDYSLIADLNTYLFMDAQNAQSFQSNVQW